MAFYYAAASIHRLCVHKQNHFPPAQFPIYAAFWLVCERVSEKMNVYSIWY